MIAFSNMSETCSNNVYMLNPSVLFYKNCSPNGLIFNSCTCTLGGVPSTYITAAEISSDFSMQSLSAAAISGSKISVSTAPGLML